MNYGKFATAINCIDGRTQIPLINFVKKENGVDYVDMITEPGPIRILAEDSDHATVDSIKRRVHISLDKHGSKCVVVAGHHDCAGNPVEKNLQLQQIRKSLTTIHSWDLGTKVVGLWIDENWEVHRVL